VAKTPAKKPAAKAKPKVQARLAVKKPVTRDKPKASAAPRNGTPARAASRTSRPVVAAKAPARAAAAPAKAPVTTRPGAIAAKTAAPRTIPAVAKSAPAPAKVAAARPAPVVEAKVAFKPLDAKALKRKKKAERHKVDEPPVRLPPPPVTSDSKMAKNRAGLTPKELEFFRSLLMEKRRELLGDVTSMEREALRSGNTNLSNLPLHMADTGTDNYEQEFTLGLVEKDRNLLREINVALAKIQDGSYGICEGTGKPISKPRLEAQPWAKYSIEHARQLEKPQYRRAY
jgi:RNA polymerase-binding protein DksA